MSRVLAQVAIARHNSILRAEKEAEIRRQQATPHPFFET